LHIGGLAIGAFITYLATLSAIDNLATDSVELAAYRIANAAALFLVTAGFGSVLVSRGFTPIAPFLYAISFGLTGWIVNLYGRGFAKTFAPASSEELPALYAIGVTFIAVAIAIVLLSLMWARKQSRFPLA
jgi:hypothetical protein